MTRLAGPGLASAVLATGLLAGCTSASTGAVASASSASASAATTAPASTVSAVPTSPAADQGTSAPNSIFTLKFSQLPNPDLNSAGFYLSWEFTGQNNVPGSILDRADEASGHVEATRVFSASVIGSPLYAYGSLWDTDMTSSGLTLLRMNPDTLATTGQVHIGGGSYSGTDPQSNHLSIAGGGLWAVSGDRLAKVSPQTLKQTRSISLPGAYTTSIAGSADGSVLIVAEADSGGRGSLQRRDPDTGKLLASRATDGVVSPVLGGVIYSGVWLSQATGMQGYVEEFDASTLGPVPGTTAGGSNGISVAVADGLVWVFRQGSEADNDYCASPVTGKARARVPLPGAQQSNPAGVTGKYVYYTTETSSGSYLKRVPVPAGC